MTILELVTLPWTAVQSAALYIWNDLLGDAPIVMKIIVLFGAVEWIFLIGANIGSSGDVESDGF